MAQNTTKSPQQASGRSANFSNLYSCFLYENKKNIEEQANPVKQDAYRAFYNFKNNGTLTPQLHDAIKRNALQCINAHNTARDVLFVFSPSSRVSNTRKRWGTTKEMLDKYRLASSFTALYATRDIPFRPNHLAMPTDFERIGVNAEEVKGKFVIIVDDVVKSGRHIDYMRKKLLDSGAAGVAAITICAKNSLDRVGLYQQNKLIPMDGKVDLKKTLKEYAVVHGNDVQLSLFEDTPQYRDVKKENNINQINNKSMQQDDLQIKKQVIAELSHNDSFKQMPDNVFQQNLEAWQKKFTPEQLKGFNDRVAEIKKQQEAQQVQAVSASVAPEQPKEEKQEQVVVKPASEVKNEVVDAINEQDQKTEAPAVKETNEKKNVDWFLPKPEFIAFCDEKKVTNKNGEAVNTVLPKFSATIDVDHLFNNKAVNTIKENGYKYVDLTVYKASDPNRPSQYDLKTSVQDERCRYNGRDCKFADRNALLDIRIDLNSLRETINKDLDGAKQIHLTFGQNCGKTGICLDKEKYQQLTNFEVKGKAEASNLFNAVIQSQKNRMGDDFIDFAYKQHTVGNAYGGTYSEKVHAPSFNFILDADRIKNLPESDKFGNISIAVVKEKIDRNMPFTKDAHGNEFQLNANGNKMPNYRVVANPHIYNDGRPDPNIVATFTIKKADLVNCPTIANTYTNKEGAQQTSNEIKVSADGFGNVKVNPEAYKRANMEVAATELTSRREMKNAAYETADLERWNKKHPLPDQAELERRKNLPSQFEACAFATEKIMEQYNAKQQAKQQTEKVEPFISFPTGVNDQQSQKKGMGV